MHPDLDASLRAIRLRADELSRASLRESATREAEVLASLTDGGRTLDEIDDDTLERCLTRFGTEEVIDALLAGAATTVPTEVEAPSPPRAVPVQGDFGTPRRHRRGVSMAWLAAAASILCAPAALWWLPKRVEPTIARTTPGSTAPPAPSAQASREADPSRPPVPSGPRESVAPPSRVALGWPGPARFDARGPAWRPSEAALPQELPSFEQAGRTLGAGGGARYVGWRLRTVIVRSASGWGSGALISADGWLLSNYHVVAQAAQQAALTGVPATLDVIMAQEIDGRLKPRPALRATLYRADPVRDLALLKLQGTEVVPHFAMASEVRDGEDCFVIGSQYNGPAWSIRSGTVLHQFEYPEDLSQMAAGVASAGAALERNRVTVTVSDAGVSPGDSGGPLLNAQGALIGLTFATSANESGGAVGWHVGLDHVRRFTEALPARPEGVPFDPWTLGLPHAATLRPQLIDGDGDGRPDTLVYHYANPARPGASEPEPVGATMFVDFAQRAVPPSEGDAAPDALTPRGLWGMEDRGGYRFGVFLAVRSDGNGMVGYVSAAGIVDEIRVGRTTSMHAVVIWRRRTDGTWTATTPATPTPLIDPARITADLDRRLEAIARRVLGVPRSAPDGPAGSSPRPDAQGPNRMGARP